MQFKKLKSEQSPLFFLSPMAWQPWIAAICRSRHEGRASAKAKAGRLELKNPK